MTTQATGAYDDPNRYARRASLEVHPDSVVMHGYQEFLLTRRSIEVLDVDAALQRKHALLKPYLTPRYLSGREVLDLGANGGFFSFLALLNGAERATAVEMDPDYVRMLEGAARALGIDPLEVAAVNITDWRRDADVVVALALIHWIYSCTALLGTLDEAVGLLASLTRYMLLIEWVDPADPAIASFGHTSWNAEVVRGPYDLPTFEKALATHFDRWEQIGGVSGTRTLYVAFRGDLEVDHSSPLPLLKPRETVIYSRRLTSHEGVEYWSRVYDLGDAILKQTTLDLAEREARILSRFSEEAFPRVLGVRPCEEGFSVVTLEKIRGTPLPAMAQSIAAGGGAALVFADDLLRILTTLNDNGIVHRDIKADNIIMRDGHPVLIDFGWAATHGESYFAPRWLGDDGRPPDGSFSDAYAMGKILNSLLPSGTPLRPVIELMTDPDAALRIDDPAVLRTLVQAVRAARFS